MKEGANQETEEAQEELEEAKTVKPPVVEPRTRAPGGMWLHSTDFEGCF